MLNHAQGGSGGLTFEPLPDPEERQFRPRSIPAFPRRGGAPIVPLRLDLSELEEP